MTFTDINTAVAAEHRRDLQTYAARRRLVALARCCKPATWRRAGSAVADWVRRGQLQPAPCTCI